MPTATHLDSAIPAFTLAPEKKAAAPRPPASPTTPNFINDVAAGKVELPVSPRVVQKLLVVLRDPDVDARKVTQVLSQDPVLAAKVLRLANSAFFGGQRSMASIDAAVALIGMQALNRLIVACGVASSFSDIPGVDMPVFWRDALVAATAANRMGARLEADAEEAYVCGLLHGTGHLILCHTSPEIANAMFKGFDVLRGADRAQVESESFGIDHPTVGGLWAETIGFPQAVADTLRRSAQPPAEGDKGLDLALRAGCALASAVARKDEAAAAFAALPARVQAKFGGTQPDNAFDKLYDALQETQPAI